MVQARVGSEGTVGMMVRMSEGLRDRIKAAAEANGRSQNSEIVATLEEKYPAPVVSEDGFQMAVFKETFSAQGDLTRAVRQSSDPDEQAQIISLLQSYLGLQSEVVEDGLASEAKRPELLQLLQRAKMAVKQDLETIRAGGVPQDFRRIRQPSHDAD